MSKELNIIDTLVTETQEDADKLTNINLDELVLATVGGGQADVAF